MERMDAEFAPWWRERWETIEIIKARELAATTDERAREIILSLAASDPWRETPAEHGLVKQQRLFGKLRPQ
jgi:hypothetical protein